MKLFTKALRMKIPSLCETCKEPDPMVHCKLAISDFDWTWYVIEYDGKNTICGYYPEPFPDGGSQSGFLITSKLESINGKSGLVIERDPDFKPCRLSELKDELRDGLL